ncbi:hypothetical protein FOS38_05610 [Lactobacillus rhamnosus]|nr:hypothetical protein [Lacticaseibacillus rhamnosus]TLQ25590.1 hypothetical protein FEZ43_04525 [Lacticaseibacillus rhamnosus]
MLNLWVVKRVHSARILRLTLTLTRSPAQKSACKDLAAMAKARPSRPRPLTLRLLPALVHAHINAFSSAEVCV